jgi:hypothetical protein
LTGFTDRTQFLALSSQNSVNNLPKVEDNR